MQTLSTYLNIVHILYHIKVFHVGYAHFRTFPSSHPCHVHDRPGTPNSESCQTASCCGHSNVQILISNSPGKHAEALNRHSFSHKPITTLSRADRLFPIIGRPEELGRWRSSAEECHLGHTKVEEPLHCSQPLDTQELAPQLAPRGS